MDTYPCLLCGEECVDDALECSSCFRWVHRNCTGMSKSDLRSWSVSSVKFFCKGCCFVDDAFDAKTALNRLLVASKRRVNLLNAASSEKRLMEFYRVGLEETTHPGRVGAIDPVSQRILQTYHPIMLQRYLPLLVTGDGNCFYRAVSRAICGSECLHLLLRLKTAIEIILNQRYYDSTMRSYVDLIQDHRIIVSNYDSLVQDTLTPGSFSDMLNFYALSAAINQPIRSYYPPQICPELSSNAFSRKVVGRDVHSKQDVTITIMWTQMRFPTDTRRFVPNHFLPLREIGADINPEVIIEAATSTDNKREQKQKKSEKSKNANKKKNQNNSKTSESDNKRREHKLNKPKTHTHDESCEKNLSYDFVDEILVSEDGSSALDDFFINESSSANKKRKQTGEKTETKCPQNIKMKKKRKQSETSFFENEKRKLSRKISETITSDESCKTNTSFGFFGEIPITENEGFESDNMSVQSIQFINDDYFSQLSSNSSGGSHTSHVFGKSSANFMSSEPFMSNNDEIFTPFYEESDKDSTTTENPFCSETSRNAHKSPQVIDLTSDQEDDLYTFDKADVRSAQNNFSSDLQNSANRTKVENNAEACFPLTKSKFLDTKTVVHILLNSPFSVERIPNGLKENVYFIVNNTGNDINEKKGRKRTFSDDCGIWKSTAGTVPCTYYHYKEDSLKLIHKKNGKFCYESKVGGSKVYIPYDPQPVQNDILVISRYYTTLKKDCSYKRRITFLGDCSFKSCLSVVEYIGRFPGLTAHGNNADSYSEYLRTPNYVMSEMKELLSSKQKPEQVYKNLLDNHDEISRPTGLSQVRDKKKYEKNKERGKYNFRNDADHFQHIDNLVTENHEYIRCVTRASNKTPTIILYTDDQVFDLKNICCRGLSVLGVDKTYNLCDMHVTVTCYKQVSVVRTKTGQAPIFVGPIFIHDGSDFETFCQFFSHLKMKLVDCNTVDLVFGSDDERALVKAIVSTFPDSTHVLCTRHLRNNAIQKLTDDAVDKKHRIEIVKKIFDKNGLVDSEDNVCFELRSSELENYCSDRAPRFLNYYKDRLKHELKYKVNQPLRNGKITGLWTNNNSESVNHVLKQATDWKSKTLIDLITTIQDISTRQFTDLRGALVDTGEYRLAESHSHFKVSKTDWIKKTTDQRTKHYKQFRSFLNRNAKHMTSTDGKTKVIAPKTHGKKPGQKRSRKNERTHSFKKRRLNEDKREGQTNNNKKPTAENDNNESMTGDKRPTYDDVVQADN